MWFFSKKEGYCVHLAALEYYLKNDQLGQEILLNLEANQEEKETVETQVTSEENSWSLSKSRVKPTSIGFLLKGRWKQEPIALSGL